jgi:hypothetical protein
VGVGRRRTAGAVEAGRGAAVAAGVQVLLLCLAQPSQCRGGFAPSCTNEVEAGRIEACRSDALRLAVSSMSGVGWSGSGALLRKDMLCGKPDADSFRLTLFLQSKCSPFFGCGVRSTSTTSSCPLPSTAPGPRGTPTLTTAPGKLPARLFVGSSLSGVPLAGLLAARLIIGMKYL